MSAKILIIDDELDLRIYLRTLFRKAGYRTEEAQNGQEGVERAKSFQPDLITLDLMMPKKSGIRAYHDLRSTPATKNIPVLVLTGLSKQEEMFGEEMAAIPPPEAIVEKPIERDSFLKLAERILGRGPTAS